MSTPTRRAHLRGPAERRARRRPSLAPPGAAKLPKPPHGEARPKPRRRPRARAPFGIASAIAAGWAAAMGLIVIGVPVLLVVGAAARTNSSAGRRDVRSPPTSGSRRITSASPSAASASACCRSGLLVVPFLLLRLSGSLGRAHPRPATLADAGTARRRHVGRLRTARRDRRGRRRARTTARQLRSAPCSGARSSRSSRRVDGRCAPPTSAATWRPCSRARVDSWRLLPAALRRCWSCSAVLAVVTLASLVIHGGDALALTRADSTAGSSAAIALVRAQRRLPPEPRRVGRRVLRRARASPSGTGTSVTLAGVVVRSAARPSRCSRRSRRRVSRPRRPGCACWSRWSRASPSRARAPPRRPDGSIPSRTALRAGPGRCGRGPGARRARVALGGPLGGGRLSAVGPSPWQVGALAALELGLVAAVAAWVLGWRRPATATSPVRPIGP